MTSPRPGVFDFRQLNTFLAIVEHSSFSAAARRLGFNEDFALTFLPSAVPLHVLHANFQLVITCYFDNEKLFRLLEEGEFDLVVANLPCTVQVIVGGNEPLLVSLIDLELPNPTQRRQVWRRTSIGVTTLWCTSAILSRELKLPSSC